MEISTVSDEEILRGLREHPHIRNRVASLLALARDPGGEVLPQHPVQRGGRQITQ